MAAGGNVARTANCSNARGLAIFGNVNAKRACFLHGECHVRRVDFVNFAFAQFAHAEINRALRNAHLNRVVVKIQERERGHARHVNGCLASLQFGACIFISPKLVADGHRAIALGRTPVALPTGLEGYRAVCVADPRYARRGIALVRSNGLRGKEEKTEH